MAKAESGSRRDPEQPMFDKMDLAGWARFVRECRIVEVAHHATLMKQAAHGRRVLLVVKGRVIIYRETAGGQRVPVNTCGSGEFVGDVNALLGRGHTATVVANGHCLVLELENERFLEAVTHMPALAEAALRQMAERLDRQTQAAASLARLSVLGRVVSRLGQLLAECGRELPDGSAALDLPGSLDAVAEQIGADRRSVGRALKKLVEAGLIVRPRRGVIGVPNLTRLLMEWPRLEEPAAGARGLRRERDIDVAKKLR